LVRGRNAVGTWVGQQEDDAEFCAQLLVFPDGVTMQVAAGVSEGSPQICPLFENAHQPGEYPGRHTCYWELPNDFDTSIRVEFSIAFCAVETGHIPFDEVAGQDDMVASVS
jgi:hypothetical protein